MLLPIFKPRGADHTRKLHLSNWARFNSPVWSPGRVATSGQLLRLTAECKGIIAQFLHGPP
jgi:hypothetical protein